MHTHPAMPLQTFMVTLSDEHGIKQIAVTSPCDCDMAEWVTDNQSPLDMVDPEIVNISLVKAAPVV